MNKHVKASLIVLAVIILVAVGGYFGYKKYSENVVESFITETLGITDQATIDQYMESASSNIFAYAKAINDTMAEQEALEEEQATAEATDTPADVTSANHEVTDPNNPVATVVIKDYGTLTYELFPEEAPETVNNFITLANSGFYDGLTCHRLIEDFMVQCGDPSGDGTGGPGYSIPGEMENNGGTSTLTHEPGALAMARSSSYDSAGSQFYTVTGEASHLDGEYTVFGYLLTGEEVLTEINSAETSSGDAPVEPIVIESVTVDTKGVTYPEPTKIQ